MKKHKSVVAILLAVMMIFTMMPTMAFATVSWSDDYKTATTDVENHVALGVNITWADSGLMTATTYNAQASVYGVTANATDDVGKTATFYDFAGSTVKIAGKTVPATMTKAGFEDIVNGVALLGVEVVQPSYTDGYVASSAKKALLTAVVEGSGEDAHQVIKAGEKWSFTAVIEGYDKNAADKDQEVTISFKKTAKSVEGAAGALGTIPSVKFTVKGEPGAYNKAKVAVDGKEAEKDWVEYDGAEHTVSLINTGNATVKYKLFSETSGKFEDVSALTFKEVGAYTWQAVATDAADAKKTKTYDGTFTIKGSTKEVLFGFNDDGDAGDYEFMVEPGTEVDPWSYVILRNKKANAAAAANEATVLEYAKDFFKITSVTRAASPWLTVYTLEAKDDKELTAEQRTALEKGKYKALLASIGTPQLDDGTIIEGKYYEGAEKLYITTLTSNDFEVSFTKIANKTIHVKKAKKTKKAYSLTVKAEAANKAPVKYTLKGAPAKIKINADTGKITIKKGLKKGKYSFTVKAYVPEHQYASGEGFVTQKIKVIVKK